MNGKRPANASAKRGRPPKFGRPGQVVAITLPDETIRELKRLNSDIGWAIVGLLRNGTGRHREQSRPAPDSELVSVANGRSLIVVNRKVFKQLPGINLIPLHGDRAFLALDREAGAADLELAVIDRMAVRTIAARERAALAELRAQLRRWRRHPRFRYRTQSIIVVEQVG